MGMRRGARAPESRRGGPLYAPAIHIYTLERVRMHLKVHGALPLGATDSTRGAERREERVRQKCRRTCRVVAKRGETHAGGASPRASASGDGVGSQTEHLIDARTDRTDFIEMGGASVYFPSRNFPCPLLLVSTIRSVFPSVFLNLSSFSLH